MKGVYEHISGGLVYFRAVGFFESVKYTLYFGKSKRDATKARKHWDTEVLPNCKPTKKCHAELNKLYPTRKYERREW
jgi:hypothetical protein